MLPPCEFHFCPGEFHFRPGEFHFRPGEFHFRPGEFHLVLGLRTKCVEISSTEYAFDRPPNTL